MNDLYHWPLVAGSLLGVVLNIRRDRRCFYVWAVTNASWCIIDGMHGIYSQSCLQFIYLCLAVWGLIEWKR